MTFRWALKRTLKWAVEWGMTLTGAGLVYRTTASFRHGYRILTYHRIEDDPQSSFGVKTDHFKSHMAFLADHYHVVGMNDLVRAVVDGPPPEPGSVAVTFDDGYAECSTVIRETLTRFAIPATFYVITGALDRTDAAQPRRYLTWDEVRELAEAGFTIGSHGVTHRSLGGLSPKEVHEELRTSRMRIEQHIGEAPEGMSFPYGTLRDFSSSTAVATKELGYRYAVTSIHGLNRHGCNPFLLRRTAMMAGDGLRTFRMILKGNLDPWYLVDKWGYSFQRAYDA